MDSATLSVIVPVYNERFLVAEALARLSEVDVPKLSSIRRLLAGIQAEPQEPEPLAHSPPAPELVYEPV